MRRVVVCTSLESGAPRAIIAQPTSLRAPSPRRTRWAAPLTAEKDRAWAPAIAGPALADRTSAAPAHAACAWRPRLRRAALFAVLGVLCASTPEARAQPATGVVEPVIALQGAEDARCGYSVRPASAAPGREEQRVPDGGPFELLVGDYALIPRCRRGEVEIVGLPTSFRVTPGGIARPRASIAAVSLRVEAKRDGILRPAKVRLYDAALGLASEPLVTLPANQRVPVAAGRYDVLVSLAADNQPPAEVLASDFRIEGPKLVVLPADLSDGSVVIKAELNGKPAEATVRAFAPGGAKDVGQVEAGQELRLPAGRYQLRTELREAADFASATREVWIQAGKLARYGERFSTGTLSVEVRRDGAPAPGTIHLARAGEAESFNFFTAPGSVALSPGTYELRLTSPELGPVEELRAPGLRVTARGRTAHVFDLSRALVTARALQADRPVAATIELRAAGGGEAIAAEAPNRWRPWPGRYELVGRLEDGTELVTEPFELELGTRLEQVLRFERARLTVLVRRGKTLLHDAEVLAFRPGAARPLARSRSGVPLELSPGVYDVKVVLGPDSAWTQGIKVRGSMQVEIPIVNSTRPETLPEGDGEVPLPEGDAP
jgi:hypothetical protein